MVKDKENGCRQKFLPNATENESCSAAWRQKRNKLVSLLDTYSDYGSTCWDWDCKLDCHSDNKKIFSVENMPLGKKSNQTKDLNPVIAASYIKSSNSEAIFTAIHSHVYISVPEQDFYFRPWVSVNERMRADRTSELNLIANRPRLNEWVLPFIIFLTLPFRTDPF